jgi:hypothetical protein
MTKRTNIEQLMDLSEIFDKNQQTTPQSHKGMQSMDGFPVPPHMDSNYNSQMSREISDREKQKSSFQGKIRQTSDYRTAMNGGNMYDSTSFYPMVSYGNYGKQQPSKVEIDEVEYKKYITDDDDDSYEMAPKVRKNQYSAMSYSPSHSSYSSHPSSHSSHPHISCIDIAKHVKSCPICSKLYENDKSIYIIAIVFLLVVCIILLKKVIESGDK